MIFNELFAFIDPAQRRHRAVSAKVALAFESLGPSALNVFSVFKLRSERYMSSQSGLIHRRLARTTMMLPPIIEADARAFLDGAPCNDYSSIIEAREARITIPLHKLIGKYAEYGRLLAG
jgi:hypothetical protein